MKLTLIMFGAVALYLAEYSLHGQPEPGVLLWRYTLPYNPTNPLARVQASPALGPEGTIYLTTDTALMALSNTPAGPSNKWTFPVAIGST